MGIEKPTTKSPCCSSPCRAKGFCTSQQRKVTAAASHLCQWIIGCWDGMSCRHNMMLRLSPLNAMTCYDDIFKKCAFNVSCPRSSARNHIQKKRGCLSLSVSAASTCCGSRSKPNAGTARASSTRTGPSCPSWFQPPDSQPRSAPVSMHQRRNPSPPHAVLQRCQNGSEAPGVMWQLVPLFICLPVHSSISCPFIHSSIKLLMSDLAEVLPKMGDKPNVQKQLEYSFKHSHAECEIKRFQNCF